MAGLATQVLIDGTPTNGANPWIDSLVWGGAWADASGSVTANPVRISYAAVSGTDPYGVLGGASMAWSADGLAALGNALKSWESVAAVDFVQTSSAASNVWFWQGTAAAAEGALGWSEVPGYSTGEPLYMVLNGQHSSWSTAGLAQGGYGYITLIHELGHLLGLAHPHDGGSASDGAVFPGVTGPFDSYGDYDLNQGIFTTMSYNDGWGSQYPSHNSMGYGWQATPMALDIAAIQAIYGANKTFATGANTYVLPKSNAAGTYWSCIWDAGGTDAISNAGSAVNCIINLNAAPLLGPNAGGYVSYGSGIVGGFTIANGVVIENATGGSGNDVLTGNGANNVLTGGLGDDTLSGGAGNDRLTGGAGVDLASYAQATENLVLSLTKTTQTTAALGVDTLSGIEGLIGGAGNDALTGDSGANFLYGGAGADTLVGGAGNDLLSGDAGTDTASYASAGSAVKVDLGIATAQATGGAGTDTLVLVENLVGSDYNDTLTGNDGANGLYGGLGNDALSGGAGSDLLAGGLGRDVLTGGLGADVFVFDTAPSSSTNFDKITDYTVGQDHIWLENGVMTGLSATNGTLGASAFAAGNFSTAQDSSDRIIYNTTTGALYYDVDGAGGRAAVMLAQLAGGLALTYADFVLI